jgi:hypothetical protein
MFVLYYIEYDYQLELIACSNNRNKLEKKKVEFEKLAQQDIDNQKQYQNDVKTLLRKNENIIRDFMLRNMDAIREFNPFKSHTDTRLDWHSQTIIFYAEYGSFSPEGLKEPEKSGPPKLYHPEYIKKKRLEIIELVSKNYQNYFYHNRNDLSDILWLDRLREPLPKLEFAEQINQPKRLCEYPLGTLKIEEIKEI